MMERFVSHVFTLFEYKNYIPGDMLVNFNDPADRLVILMSGNVSVEFEHSQNERARITLNEGQCFGDFAILLEEDWADSTCFNFKPNATDELTSIQVTPTDYVVTLQLTAEKFQKAYNAASMLIKNVILDFKSNWMDKRRQVIEEAIEAIEAVRLEAVRLHDAKGQHQLGNDEIKLLKIIRLWEFVARALIKHCKKAQSRQEEAQDGKAKDMHFAQIIAMRRTPSQSQKTSAALSSAARARTSSEPISFQETPEQTPSSPPAPLCMFAATPSGPSRRLAYAHAPPTHEVQS
jgi:CRP-like cAMP-binding protein